MDFMLSNEQRMLQKLAAQFAENELEPMAAELDETHCFPVENFQKMAVVLAEPASEPALGSVSAKAATSPPAVIRGR